MRLVYPVLIALLIGPASVKAQGHSPCFPPAEPYQYKIDKKNDREFYDFARDEFQTYLEDMEKHLRCLEIERAVKLEELRINLNLFKQNFGKDAVFKYENNQ